MASKKTQKKKKKQTEKKSKNLNKSSKTSSLKKKKITKKEVSEIKKPAHLKSSTQLKQEFPTLRLTTREDIALDFAKKLYDKFGELIKAVILFGSTSKHTRTAGSDIDIIIIVDDASVRFDEEMVFWYREELGKLIQQNPYRKELHINTLRLTVWWMDLLRGDPVVINIIRYGEALIDIGGFFAPFKALLQRGKIKPTPEAIHAVINRAPYHILRSRLAEMSAIEGTYWAMIDSAQALLMAMGITPPSPEHVTELLKVHYVDKGLLNRKYIDYINSVYTLHKKITHGEIKDIEGRIIDDYQKKAEEFFKETVSLLNKLL